MNPPKHLKACGKAFFRKADKDFDLPIHDLELLTQACDCLDRIEEDRIVIERDGATFLDRYKQVKEHPRAVAMRANKVLFMRLIREMGLSVADASDTRPPKRKY